MLNDSWVLVSAGRSDRPWLGHVEQSAKQYPIAFDPGCYLCPGNQRATGNRNPNYQGTFVFENDFAALRPGASAEDWNEGLFQIEEVQGLCRVICYSPRHDVSLGRLSMAALREIIDTWAQQTDELGSGFHWVQVFENRGSAMGASNPHPHGQIWAVSAIPSEATREVLAQQHHHQATGRRLLVDYADQESTGPRVVEGNENWLAVVPFWAAWPFETLVIPRNPMRRLPDVDDVARDDLARLLIGLLARYDNLFETDFPYSMGWHQAPSNGDDYDFWQLHAHFFPPLLRSATVRKFMVGYELLAEVQRDLTPEHAAVLLQTSSPIPASVIA